MLTLGVILARAGSKGLPGKCMRLVRGRPLLQYTFDHARAARRLTAFVLSSDSHEALALAAARSVESIERPAELATDTARVDAAARHAVEVWEARHARRVEAVAVLYGNIPVRAAGAIDRAIEHLERSGGSSVRTVAPIGKHHPDWLHRLDGDRMRQFRPNSISRRQDLEPLYYHNGAVVAVTREALFAAAAHPEDGQAFLGADRRAIVQAPDDAVDVDEAADLAVAEAVLGARRPPQTLVPIGSRAVGSGRPTYLIAEAGVNHDGDVDQALRLIEVAAHAGADAVKFQIFSADELATVAAPLADYQRARPAGGDPNAGQRELLRRLELRAEDWPRLRAHCGERGVDFLATPFGIADVERLRALHVPAVKIASTDIDNVPLLRAAALLGRPLIVSTGASTACEIDTAVERLEDLGVRERLVLLHCVSAYPTPPAAANIRAIATLSARFGLVCGFSDHTTLLDSGAWAVAAGACVLEKHFTLDRSAVGPDHAMSLSPEGLREYVARVRSCEAALGRGELGLSEIEAPVRAVARKSIVAACDLEAGARLSAHSLAVKRPGGGIGPDCFDALIGRELAVGVRRDTPLAWEMLR